MEKGADVNKGANDGWIPLHVAANHGRGASLTGRIGCRAQGSLSDDLKKESTIVDSYKLLFL